MYICFTPFSTILFFNVFDIVLPNKGIAFLFIAIASKAPSTNTIGIFQLICNSNPTISFEVGGFLCFHLSSS